MVSGEPRQASLRRLRRFGIRPNRELGQNFLVDDNLLEVIGRLAEVSPDDVVLEIAGGSAFSARTSRRASRTCTWSRPIGASSPCSARPWRGTRTPTS